MPNDAVYYYYYYLFLSIFFVYCSGDNLFYVHTRLDILIKLFFKSLPSHLLVTHKGKLFCWKMKKFSKSFTNWRLVKRLLMPHPCGQEIWSFSETTSPFCAARTTAAMVLAIYLDLSRFVLILSSLNFEHKLVNNQEEIENYIKTKQKH